MNHDAVAFAVLVSTFGVAALGFAKLLSWLKKLLAPLLGLLVDYINHIKYDILHEVMTSIMLSMAAKLRLSTSEVGEMSLDIVVFASHNSPLWHVLVASNAMGDRSIVAADTGTRYLFVYKFSPILVAFNEDKSRNKYCEFTALCSKEKLAAFVAFISSEAERIESEQPNFRSSITLLQHDQNGDWEMSMIYGRPMPSVFLPERISSRCIEAIDKFKANEKMLGRLGIPHRMGVLLRGIPGSGKTSFVRALAEKYGVAVFVLSVGDRSMNDSILAGLIKGVQEDSFILIEDLSALRVARAVQSEDYDESEYGVTLSGLLNAIDGINSPEHVVFFFTANDDLKIDPAMRRAGRIDLEFEFGAAEPAEIERAFWWFYGQNDANQALAREFVAAIGDRQVSMAEVMFVIRNSLDSPERAIAAIAPYLDERAEAKKPKGLAARRRKTP